MTFSTEEVTAARTPPDLGPSAEPLDGRNSATPPLSAPVSEKSSARVIDCYGSEALTLRGSCEALAITR